MNECQHINPNGKKCDQEFGHSGLHGLFEHGVDTVGENGIPETNIHMYKWNDNGQERPEEKGESASVDYDKRELHEAVIESLIADARANLKPGQVFEIRGRERPRDGADDYGRTPKTRRQRAEEWGMAWYWMPSPAEMPKGFERFALTQEPLFRHTVEHAIDDIPCGIILIARLVA